MECRGAIVGIIGPNGAGKTTLIDAICGFAHGKLGLSRSPARRVSRASVTPSSPGAPATFQGVDLYEDLTVEENVMVGQARQRSSCPPLDEVPRAEGLGLEGARLIAP